MNWFTQKILGLFVKTRGKISKPLYGGKGHALMMHRVLPKEDVINSPFNKSLSISPEKLEEVILLYKSKNYNFISLDELESTLKSKKNSAPFVCFTIDDGYKDNLKHGLPIFEKYKVPFCIYVTSCFPDKTATFWWYLLEEYVNKNNSIKFEINKESFHFEWENDKELKIVYPKIKVAFKKVPPSRFQDFIKEVFKVTDEDIKSKAEKLSLTWKEIETLSNHPLVTIGGHTVSHSSLSNLSKEAIYKEVNEANQRLKEMANVTVEHFAYPYGGRNDVNSKVSEILKKIPSIQSAVLNLPGNISTTTLETLELIPRYPLGESFNLQKLENQENGILHFSNNGFNKKIQLD